MPNDYENQEIINPEYKGEDLIVSSPVMLPIQTYPITKEQRVELIESTHEIIREYGYPTIMFPKRKLTEHDYDTISKLKFDYLLSQAISTIATVGEGLHNRPRELELNDPEVLQIVRAYVQILNSEARGYLKEIPIDEVIGNAQRGGIIRRFSKIMDIVDKNPSFFSHKNISHPLFLARSALVGLSDESIYFHSADMDQLDHLLFHYQTEEVLSWLGQQDLLAKKSKSPNGFSDEQILVLREEGKLNENLYSSMISFAIARLIYSRPGIAEGISKKDVRDLISGYLLYAKFKIVRYKQALKLEKEVRLERMIESMASELSIDSGEYRQYIGINRRFPLYKFGYSKSSE